MTMTQLNLTPLLHHPDLAPAWKEFVRIYGAEAMPLQPSDLLTVFRRRYPSLYALLPRGNDIDARLQRENVAWALMRDLTTQGGIPVDFENAVKVMAGEAPAAAPKTGAHTAALKFPRKRPEDKRSHPDIPGVLVLRADGLWRYEFRKHIPGSNPKRHSYQAQVFEAESEQEAWVRAEQIGEQWARERALVHDRQVVIDVPDLPGDEGEQRFALWTAGIATHYATREEAMLALEKERAAAIPDLPIVDPPEGVSYEDLGSTGTTTDVDQAPYAHIPADPDQFHPDLSKVPPGMLHYDYWVPRGDPSHVHPGPDPDEIPHGSWNPPMDPAAEVRRGQHFAVSDVMEIVDWLADKEISAAASVRRLRLFALLSPDLLGVEIDSARFEGFEW